MLVELRIGAKSRRKSYLFRFLIIEEGVNDENKKGKTSEKESGPEGNKQEDERGISHIKKAKRMRLRFDFDSADLFRAFALLFADDGKLDKICIQGPMGEGALVRMPL